MSGGRQQAVVESQSAPTSVPSPSALEIPPEMRRDLSCETLLASLAVPQDPPLLISDCPGSLLYTSRHGNWDQLGYACSSTSGKGTGVGELSPREFVSVRVPV